jgi:solute carrier family 41
VRRHLILGNLSLLQVQALLVSCLAAAFAFLISLLIPAGSTDTKPAESLSEETAYALLRLMTRTRPPHHPPVHRPTNPASSGLHEFLIALLIAQTAASLSSLILGSFMCSLVLLCRYFRLNPDNIAPAVASALGDLLTLTILGLSSHFLFPMSIFGLLLIQVGYILSFCISFYMTLKNPRVKGLLVDGWSPLIGAMVISSGTGMILEGFVGKYKDYGLVSIAQDGIPGSVGSVYISRLSTALHEAVGHIGHQRGDGHEHTHHPATAPQPSRSRSWNFFTPKNDATKVAIEEARPKISGLALFLVTVPAQILFLVAAYAAEWLTLPALWACGFVIFFSSAVCAFAFFSFL